MDHISTLSSEELRRLSQEAQKMIKNLLGLSKIEIVRSHSLTLELIISDS